MVGSIYKKQFNELLKALFFVGFGVALHDYLHTMYVLGGYGELISLQGGYIGFIVMFITFLLIIMKGGER